MRKKCQLFCYVQTIHNEDQDTDTKLRNEIDLVEQSIEQIGEVLGKIIAP